MNDINLSKIQQETAVQEISYFDELSSTNDEATRLAKEKATNVPHLILAKNQTNGRGRGANQWWSSEGCLTFSLVVDVSELAADNLCKISLTCGLAICQALERFAPMGDFGLKWPNDVYLEGRKICGILIERPIEDQVVIGVGINVNNRLAEAPEEVASIAVSLFDLIETPLDLTDVIIESLNQLERRIAELATDNRSILDQWQAYDLLRLRNVRINTYSQIIEGTCHGIDADGALIVQTDTEEHRCIGGIVESFD